MGFKDQIVEDARNIFLDSTTGFAEDIVYTPYGGTAKTIKAVVERKTLEPNQQGSTSIVGRELEISILNDADEGVADVVKGQDKVSLPVWSGGESVDWVVVDISFKDEAMFLLKIRR